MNIDLRPPTIDDLIETLLLTADDFLGQQRSDFSLPLNERYIKAFHEIDADPNNELIVATMPGTDASGPLAVRSIVGTMQLTFTPSLSFQGGRRCTVESVRVDETFRGLGIGREMMLWAIERAKDRGCISMQLTSHVERPRAHSFYEQLGFAKSHVGMKLKLK